MERGAEFTDEDDRCKAKQSLIQVADYQIHSRI